MAFSIIKAYAKINLSLEIGEKRLDGFHSLSSIFTKISLHDTLFFYSRKTNKDKKTLIYMNGKRADESNTMTKAINLYCQRFNLSLSTVIFCYKRIPSGGGLGGGSSDGAAILQELNRRYKMASDSELLDLAAKIGSDVPFFLSGSVAYVSGRGEKVEVMALRKQPLWGVLLLPEYFSSTATAYKAIDDQNLAKKSFRNDLLEKEIFYKPLKDWPYDNDFLPILCQQSQLISETVCQVKDLKPVYWNCSGSGSSLYALFEKKKEQYAFYKKFKKKKVRKKNFFLV